MSGDFEADVAALARRYALQNAVQQSRDAMPGPVVGKIMAERAEWRARSKDIAPIVARVVAEVNALDAEARRSALEADAPELLEKKAAAEKIPRLAELVDAEKRRVVMRFAPNPSGPGTLGHARGMVVHWQYKERYDAHLILRFDDTDPTVKRPMLEAYDWIREDFEWLCGKPDEVIIASDRVPLYLEHAEKVLSIGGAYVCECPGDVFREMKNKGEACPHRERSVDENVDAWKRMLDGRFAAGEAVVRIKTDIEHKDPALRDWVGLRIVRDSHPRVGDAYRVWPVLDFQSAVDDHLTGVTHIIRGKDLRDSTLKQRFLYEHFGWEYPKPVYWGRVSVHEFGKFSKSILAEAIARGEYDGWDDPRLPTLRALRRRGFKRDAITAFWVGFGLSEKDVAASVKTLEAENRKVVEPTANRYFFVENPVEVALEGAPVLECEAPLHPDHPERGTRTHRLEARAEGIEVVVPRGDWESIDRGSRIRLKDLANVEFDSRNTARYVGNDLAFLQQGGRIIHWAPAQGSVPVQVRLPDGSYTQGVAERQLAEESVGAVVQFERYGFCRVDATGPEGVRLYFTHK